MKRRRVNPKAILTDQDLRRELMVPTIQPVQASEGIETTRDQAERAYYVVNEADKAAFFDLERFVGGKRSELDRREEMFVRALTALPERVRFDVPRRDFGAIEGSPLAFRRVGLVAHVFRDAPALDPLYGRARQGAGTADDPRYVRRWWEVEHCLPRGSLGWVPFAKGGPFGRFYSDIFLRVHWDHARETFAHFYGRKGREQARPVSASDFFKSGLTWPRAGGCFSVRWLPRGCVFADKGPVIMPTEETGTAFLAGVLNSSLVEYLLLGLTSRQSIGARWEVGLVKKLPVPSPTPGQHRSLGGLALSIHDAKASWDGGNETSIRFEHPWFLHEELATLKVLDRLDHLAEHEATEEARIQQLYADLNDEVYKLYGIPDATRTLIEETLGERPPEILWPQMERKSVEQKRMEHVWRLLSYVVKRVVDADEDGIVPFMAMGGETALIDRVRGELAALFPNQDSNQVEVDIANELKRKVKGYRSVESIGEWLEDIFFDYHVSLYKKRPIIWHIASSQGRGACAIGALAHYHKFDRDRLAKLRGSYLRDAIAHFRREAGLAAQEGRTEDRQEWQARLEEAQVLDQRLQWVQEGKSGHPAPGDCRIRTPWKSEDELPVGWQPDLDDGVAVNILPLQNAGVLRIPKVV